MKSLLTHLRWTLGLALLVGTTATIAEAGNCHPRPVYRRPVCSPVVHPVPHVPVAPPVAAYQGPGLGIRGQVQQGLGVIIGEVMPGRPASLIGLLPGDVILQINQRRIHCESDYFAALEEVMHGFGGQGTLVVMRGPGQVATVPFSLVAAPQAGPAVVPTGAPQVPAAAPGNVLPRQPGAVPPQPSAIPGQPGAFPGQPSAIPGQPGAFPGQPSAIPGQPGAAPGQPGTIPGQPGQPGAVPGQPGMIPGQAGPPVPPAAAPPQGAPPTQNPMGAAGNFPGMSPQQGNPVPMGIPQQGALANAPQDPLDNPAQPGLGSPVPATGGVPTPAVQQPGNSASPVFSVAPSLGANP